MSYYYILLYRIILSIKLFPHIHGYLFIFANTEIYVKFDKFFRCMAHSGFNCSKIKIEVYFALNGV